GVREIVILRASDGVRQPVEPQLGETVLELLQMLAAEMGEDEVARRAFALARDERQHEAGHQRVVELRNRAIARERALDLHAGLVRSAAPTRSWSSGDFG